MAFLVSNASPSSPWGENVIDPVPKLETGWANFDSSFGEPMMTNKEDEILPDHQFSCALEQSILNNITPPLKLSVNTNSLIDNLTGKIKIYFKFKFCKNLYYIYYF